jgi:nicotinamide riboside transporter PnuC
MTQYLGLDWLAMCLTFFAIYLLGNKNRLGFAVMITGNVCWSTIGLWAHSYAMVLANLGFLAMNVRGIFKWSRQTSA